MHAKFPSKTTHSIDKYYALCSNLFTSPIPIQPTKALLGFIKFSTMLLNRIDYVLKTDIKKVIFKIGKLNISSDILGSIAHIYPTTLYHTPYTTLYHTLYTPLLYVTLHRLHYNTLHIPHYNRGI